MEGKKDPQVMIDSKELREMKDQIEKLKLEVAFWKKKAEKKSPPIEKENMPSPMIDRFKTECKWLDPWADPESVEKLPSRSPFAERDINTIVQTVLNEKNQLKKPTLLPSDSPPWLISDNMDDIRTIILLSPPSMEQLHQASSST